MPDCGLQIGVWNLASGFWNPRCGAWPAGTRPHVRAQLGGGRRTAWPNPSRGAAVPALWQFGLPSLW